MSDDKLLLRALERRNTARPPVWFMRQAGRYHRHYQRLRARHEFIDLCKRPELAVEVTLGPIEDFGFDAAILFSDLLFPLEAMGMGLTYEPGPKLGWHLRTAADLSRLTGGAARAQHMSFQAEALTRLRTRLPHSCGLIGFVGGPMTLYAYAVAGSHEGFVRETPADHERTLFPGFIEQLQPLLVANMVLQAQAGADCVAMFDTAAGALSPAQFRELVVPSVAGAIAAFREHCPDTPLMYYSRDTGPEQWSMLRPIDFQCLGIDWRHDMAQALPAFGERWALQGNIDPQWLLQEPAQWEPKVRALFERVLALPATQRAGWVCGLGHGVLQHTPEANVHRVLRIQREMFG
ncbi:MAG TPA: uroporphyrinogen decarboxylase family protein [Steroidobacteraceae bacterium]|nr:uroporphyrinogen decarboxylase family protein [Steroidobacteraceae bacterium]